MLYNIYILSIRDRAKKNIYKIGKHKGNKAKLLKRYQNALINPKIYFFVGVNDYTLIETLIKQKLYDHRIDYPNGKKSEWVKLELEKIITCINRILKKHDVVEEPDNNLNNVREDNENPERDFLLKNSTIPYEMIDILYNIFSVVHDEKDLWIDLNTVAKLLGARKDNLKRLLIKHLSKDVDYNIEKVKMIRKIGANSLENIKITLSCFKELCIVSIAPQIKEIRKFALQAEKVLNEYNNILMAAFD